MGRHLVVVLHGPRAERQDVRDAVQRVRAEGHRVEVCVTWEPGDATRFAQRAAEAGADVVVAAGGDGTVNEVVNGLGDDGPALGILPLGTANDLAVQLGIPEDAYAALQLAATGIARRIDAAECNGRRFLNVSSGGVAARITAETPEPAKHALGKLAYALTAVTRLGDLVPYVIRAEAPGWSWAGEAVVVTVANARATGGGTEVAPEASVTDGLLDLVIVADAPAIELAGVALDLSRGAHAAHAAVEMRKVREVVITSEPPLPVNLDGELMTARELRYRALPRALSVFCTSLPG